MHGVEQLRPSDSVAVAPDGSVLIEMVCVVPRTMVAHPVENTAIVKIPIRASDFAFTAVLLLFDAK